MQLEIWISRNRDYKENLISFIQYNKKAHHIVEAWLKLKDGRWECEWKERRWALHSEYGAWILTRGLKFNSQAAP